jgi:hypothetical protein
LVPALRAERQVLVNLDGVEGYGSSFLEEAFGGTIREAGFTAAELHEKLVIETVDPAWLAEVWHYIDHPAANRPRH